MTRIIAEETPGNLRAAAESAEENPVLFSTVIILQSGNRIGNQLGCQKT
jgi:hypothetical protein